MQLLQFILDSISSFSFIKFHPSCTFISYQLCKPLITKVDQFSILPSIDVNVEISNSCYDLSLFLIVFQFYPQNSPLLHSFLINVSVIDNKIGLNGILSECKWLSTQLTVILIKCQGLAQQPHVPFRHLHVLKEKKRGKKKTFWTIAFFIILFLQKMCKF